MTEGGKVSVRSKADNHVSWSLRGAGCLAGLDDDETIGTQSWCFTGIVQKVREML
jgi:hypothetical protein